MEQSVERMCASRGANIGEARDANDDDMVGSCLRAVSLDPKNIELCQRLVCALEQRGNVSETVGAWCALGAALATHECFEEAVPAYQQALARKRDCLRALIRLGRLHIELGLPERAASYFQQAIAIRPQHRWAHFGLGWAFLLLGDFERGWEELAFETRELPQEQLDTEQPYWDGGSLEGKTILLWSDWGMGDAIQFLRYAPSLKARGARVLVACSHALAPLVEWTMGVDGVIVSGMPLPAFDVHASLVSLPRLSGTRAATIPAAVPYIGVDDALRRTWQGRLDVQAGVTMNVGLVWAGRPEAKDARYRFLPPAALAPLSGIPGVRFVSLQHPPQSVELETSPAGLPIDVFAEESESILQTAALVQRLDLIITVDTMIGHLAGALGRPVWMLLCSAPDWRWQRSGDRSPWYPTMRLFRQTKRGEWSDVIAYVRASLEFEATRQLASHDEHRGEGSARAWTSM